MAIFFFASVGASSAYLTAGEIFPFESPRAAIVMIYPVGAAIGGIFAPLRFGVPDGKHSTWVTAGGYILSPQHRCERWP
jgi:hypothetical protein